jgi:hypothetical protein
LKRKSFMCIFHANKDWREKPGSFAQNIIIIYYNFWILNKPNLFLINIIDSLQKHLSTLSAKIKICFAPLYTSINMIKPNNTKVLCSNAHFIHRLFAYNIKKSAEMLCCISFQPIQICGKLNIDFYSVGKCRK